MINEETTNVHQQIFGDKDFEHTFKFDYNESKMKEYLSFIYSWNGLTSSAKLPSTKKQYQNKARNWLNGRRKKQYGNTFYSDMISQAITVWIIIYSIILRPKKISVILQIS